MLKCLTALLFLGAVAGHSVIALAGPGGFAAGLYAARMPEAPEAFRAGLVEAAHRQQGDALSSLIMSATALMDEHKYQEAAPLIAEAEAYIARAGGTRVQQALVIEIKGQYLAGINQYEEAEALLKRAIELKEQVWGLNNAHIIGSLQMLTQIYLRQHRLQEAYYAVGRAYNLAFQLRGKDPVFFATIEDTLGYVFLEFGQAAKAEERFLDVRAIVAAAGDRAATALVDDHLALTYLYLLQYEKARQFAAESLAIVRRLSAADSPQAVTAELNLAVIDTEGGIQLEEAEQALRHVLSFYEAKFGREDPDTAKVHNNLGWLELKRQRPREAAAWFRQSLGMYEKARRAQAFALSSQEAPGGVAERETARTIRGFLEAAAQLSGPANDQEFASEAFRAAQWAHISDAAIALNKTYARLAAGNDRLASLIRDQQDLSSQWRKLDAELMAARTVHSAQRNPALEARMRSEKEAIAQRVAEIGQTVIRDFPKFASVANPEPVTVADAQKNLAPNEALVQFVFFGNPTVNDRNGYGSFVFAVTQKEVRFFKLALDPAGLLREVQALRCGLDQAAWDGPSCQELTGQNYSENDRGAGVPPPFDHARAYNLYRALFGQIKDFVKEKSLLIEPSGALTQLPFQVLIAEAPTSGDNRTAAWLIRQHALTVLPAASALVARQAARPSEATQPMTGFGNPLLDGDPSSPDDRARAELARQRQHCQDAGGQGLASAGKPPRGMGRPPMRGGLADVSFIRRQAPLPETADELCAVAREVGAGADDIHLGAHDAESEVKRLSESGQLARYRIIHFATHGALAGQVRGNEEPGLLLTPPAAASAEDDGFLTATEIAALRLDADWVILSACNTAAGGAQDDEAFSGLARAFLYAQARALLVSHWEVDSQATVQLVTGAIGRLAANKSIGRAEAMRQSMLALIDNGARRDGHPSIWAPFVVVGEGGAGR